MTLDGTEDKLRFWQEWVLILMVYTLPVHEASKNVLWSIALALYIARHVIQRRLPRLHGAVGLFSLAWLASCTISTPWAIDQESSLKGLWDQLRGVAGFWLVASSFESKASKKQFLGHFVVSTSIASLWAWVDYGLKISEGAFRSEYTHVQLPSVGHFNQSGIYLGMAWMIVFAYCIDRDVSCKKRISIFVLLLVGLALLGTTARTIAIIAALGTLGLIWDARPPRWITQTLLAVLIITTFAVISIPSLKNRILFRGSLQARTSFWESTLRELPLRPWTGVGLNNFKNIALETNVSTDFGTVDHAHSLYFNSLAQTGILGLASMTLLLISSFIALIKVRKNSTHAPLVFRACAGVWWIAVLGGLTNTPIHHEMGLLFFLMMGLMSSPQARVVRDAPDGRGQP